MEGLPFFQQGESPIGNDDSLVIGGRCKQYTALRTRNHVPCFWPSHVQRCLVSVVGFDFPFMPNEVVFSAGGYGNVLVPLMVCSKSVEKTVPMGQKGLFTTFAGAFVRVPRDMRKGLTKFMDRRPAGCASRSVA